MKLLKALLLTVALLSSDSFARGGGTIPPACTASVPTQATAVGLTVLKKCDNFSTLQSIDVNNTQQQGFHWYTQSPESYPTTPTSSFTNNGLALSILSSGSVNGGQAMSTTGRFASSPFYSGVPITGSYYAQMTLAIPSPNTPAGQTPGNTPGFWTASANDALNGTIAPSNWPFVELDAGECVVTTIGQPCILNFQFHVWNYSGGTVSNTCSSGALGGATVPGGTVLTNFNKYGILVLRAADNGGVGRIEFYVNDVSVQRITYSGTTITSASGSLSGTNCNVSDLSAVETMATRFIVGAGVNWATNPQSFQVWQLN